MVCRLFSAGGPPWAFTPKEVPQVLFPCLGRAEGAESCLALAGQKRQGSRAQFLNWSFSPQQNPSRASNPAQAELILPSSVISAWGVQKWLLHWARGTVMIIYMAVSSGDQELLPKLLRLQHTAQGTATEWQNTSLLNKWILILMRLASSVLSKRLTRLWWGRERDSSEGQGCPGEAGSGENQHHSGQGTAMGARRDIQWWGQAPVKILRLSKRANWLPGWKLGSQELEYGAVEF